jgi:predicted RNA-binding Zn-ribbon protein involved in translation (DUF1610 family)
MKVITNFYSFECPNCGEDLSGDDAENVMDLCNEPYNGTIIECESCHAEVDCTLQVVMETTPPPNNT